MAEFSDEFNRLAASLKRAGHDTKMFKDGFREATEAGKGVNTVLDSMQALLDKSNQAFKGLSNVVSDLKETLKENLAEISKQNTAVKDGTRAYRKLVSEVTKLADEESDIYALNSKTLKTIRDRTRSSLIEIKLAAKRLALNKGITNIFDKQQLREAKLKDDELALIKAAQSRFTLEEKGLKLAEGRLQLEENVERSLRGSLNLVGAFQKIAGGIGLTGFAKDLTDISDQLNNDIRKSIRKNAEDEIASEKKLYGVSLKIVRSLDAKLARGEELTKQELVKYNRAKDNVDKQEEEVLLRTKNLGLVQRTLLTFKQIPKIAGALLKNLTDVNFIMAAIYKNFTAVDAAGVELQRITGQNAKAMAGMNSNIVTSVETLKMMGEVSSRINMNLNGIMGTEQVGRLTETVKMLGLGADEAAGLAKFSTISGQSIDEFTDSVVQGTNNFTKLNGKAVNHGQVMQDVLSTSDDIALSLGGDAGRIAAAAAAARGLGMDLKRVDGIANSLMDFESSIQNELEAQLLTGGRINLAKAREFALNNNLKGLSEELANNGASAAEFSQMNRIQQESLAKALGMSREELAKSLVLRELNAGKSAEELARSTNMTKEQIMQISVQEKLNTLVSKLGQAFGPILDVLHPIVDLVGAIVAPIANSISHVAQLGVKFRQFVDKSEGFRSIMDGIKGTMGSVVGFMESATSKVTSFLGEKNVQAVLGFLGGAGKVALGATAIGLGVKKLMKGKLGTKSNPMVTKDVNGGSGAGDIANQVGSMFKGKMFKGLSKVFSKIPGMGGASKMMRGMAAKAMRPGMFKGAGAAGGGVMSKLAGGAKSMISKGASGAMGMLGKAGSAVGGLASKAGGALSKMNPMNLLKSGIGKNAMKILKIPVIASLIEGFFAKQDIEQMIAGASDKNTLYQTVGTRVAEALGSVGGASIGGALGSIIPGGGTLLGALGGEMLGRHGAKMLAETLGADKLGKWTIDNLFPEAKEAAPIPLATGGIVQSPTNAIVGEAGAEAVIPLREFYAKMDELINVVKQGGDVYMDGNKVGSAMVLSTYKSN